MIWFALESRFLARMEVTKLRSYGQSDFDRISVDGFRVPQSKPRLCQTADRFVMLGNPAAAEVHGIDPITGNGLLVNIVRNRVPGGREIVEQNPGVTSGGGSNPFPIGFFNGGVIDPKDGLGPGLLGGSINDPSGQFAQYSNVTESATSVFGQPCNCPGNKPADSSPVLDSNPPDSPPPTPDSPPPRPGPTSPVITMPDNNGSTGPNTYGACPGGDCTNFGNQTTGGSNSSGIPFTPRSGDNDLIGGSSAGFAGYTFTPGAGIPVLPF